jgi:prenyltransferase beta subunit
MNRLSQIIITAGCSTAVLASHAATAFAADAAAPVRVSTAEMTREAEAAIDRALRFLDSTQNPDGSWGTQYKSAETALALMAFMVKGHFPGRGQYGAKLDKGINYLLSVGRQKGGFLGGGHQGMYEHGLATLALSEAWGESDNDQIRDVLKKAVEVILRAQNPQGGWRYSPQPTDADISVTVMMVVALASASEAGILVPEKHIDRAAKYVLDCQHPSGGFTYQAKSGPPNFARTGAGVLSYFMAGQRTTPGVKKGLDYLTKYEDTKFQNVQWYFYAHYYAAQATYQAGDQYFQPWYPKIRDALLAKQRSDGGFSGADGGAGPAYSTSLAVLILGIPYRFLPIYQR